MTPFRMNTYDKRREIERRIGDKTSPHVTFQGLVSSSTVSQVVDYFQEFIFILFRIFLVS